MKKHLLSMLIITSLLTPALITSDVFASYWVNSYQFKNSNNLSIGERIRLKIAARKNAQKNYQFKTKSTNYLKKQNLTKTKTQFTPSSSSRIKNNFSRKFYYESNANLSAKSITANIKTFRQKTRTIIDTTPISALEINFRNPRSFSSDYIPAEYIEQLKLSLSDNYQNLADFSDILLEIKDGTKILDTLEFSKSGDLGITFKNLRLATGENKTLKLNLKFKNPARISFKNYSLQLKLEQILAKNKSVRIFGETVSSPIKIFPTTTGSIGNSNLNGFSSSAIEGGGLSSGEKAVLLALNLSANYDDFQLQSVDISNDYGNNVDSLISRIWLINGYTGEKIASTRFVGGKAKFRHLKEIIGRNQTKKFAFLAEFNSFIPKNLTERRIKLSLSGSDLEIWGLGSGRQLPISNTHLNIQAETFTISENGADGGISTVTIKNQPALVSTGNLDQVYKFKITNSGSKYMALGRVSFDIYLSGMQYSGGSASLDDFDLVVLNSYGNEVSYKTFNPTNISGSKIIFDAVSQILLEGHQTRTFALKLKLENLVGNDKSDSVTIKILGDTQYQKSDLSSLRSLNKNFIWSDYSGSPHTISSQDWLTGYQFKGLPTNNYVKYK